MYRTGFIDLRDGNISDWSLDYGLRILTVDGGLSLTLDDGATRGQADSPVLATSFPASAAIPSWSACTPDGSWRELLVRARQGELWSSWFSLGVWASGDGTVKRQSIAGQQGEGSRLDTDTLRLETPSDAFQLRLKLYSVDGKALPLVRRICVAYSDPKPELVKVAASTADAAGAVSMASTASTAGATQLAYLEDRAGWAGELANVPRCSQMVYPDGGKVWCSPTCVAMVLSYWMKNPGPYEPVIRKAVEGTYDCVYKGNGNWAFNTAYAAAEGFDACVARFPSLASLEPWLDAGVPIALSVSWNNDNGRVLSGAPLSSSSGHLTLLVGFDAAGNPIMHEPASPDDRYVRRIYRRSELQERWLTASGGTCYLIYPQGHPVPALS